MSCGMGNSPYDQGYRIGFAHGQNIGRMDYTCLACGATGDVGLGPMQQLQEPHTCKDCTELRERTGRLSGELERLERVLQSTVQLCDAMGEALDQARRTLVRLSEARPNNQVVGDAARPFIYKRDMDKANMGPVPPQTQIRTAGQASPYRKLSVGFGVEELGAKLDLKE